MKKATKKDAYYFSHDANAQDDPKCLMLIDQLGMEGYGCFWAIIEKLRQEKNFKLPFSVLSPLAKRWNTSKEKLKVVVTKFDLFEIEGDMFFSLRLNRSMAEYYKYKQIRIEAGRKGGQNSAQKRLPKQTSSKPQAQLELSSTSTQPLKETETKENQNITKKINERSALSTHSIQDYVTTLKNIMVIPEQLSYEQCLELEKQYTTRDIKQILFKINNYSGLEKYNSVFDTCLMWLQSEKGIHAKKNPNTIKTLQQVTEYISKNNRLPDKADYKSIFKQLPLTKIERMSVLTYEEEKFAKEYLSKNLLSNS